MKKTIDLKKFSFLILVGIFMLSFAPVVQAATREERRQKEIEEMQEKFQWWPTDATPQPVKDEDRGGFWWWPNDAGSIGNKGLWGNRGYIYLYKIIYDYKEEELPPPEPQEMRPSLLIKNIIRNVKIYFDYDRATLRDDAVAVLEKAVKTMNKNPETEILITGNADIRGSESYNDKLGRRRGDAVKEFMLSKGIPEDRVLIVSRGKLDAVAPVTDLVGMQKDRNAQFMIAEVEEVMIPYPGEAQAEEPGALPLEEGKYIVDKEEQVEGEIKVSTKEYVIQKNDTLGKIAKEQMGGAHRWKYLYEINKDIIKDPNKLPVGKTIVIPVEVDSTGIDTTVDHSQAAPVEAAPAPESAAQPEAAVTEAPVETPGTESAAPAAAGKEYTIQKGDTLGEISLKELGTSKRWREIVELNKDKIKDPNRLIVGQKIILPAVEKAE